MTRSESDRDDEPVGAYRTELPPDRAWVPRGYTPVPQAADNATVETVLLYGPRGEAILRRVPRPVGFRRP